MNKTQRGFTIIELIVVIAIIAVLATIVMINVTGYIAKSKDAAIKGNMQTIASSAAGIYDSYKAYNSAAANSVCGSPTGLNVIAQITNSLSNGAPSCQNNTGSWCMCANLLTVSGNTYCVDSTGYKKENATACSTRCNATSQACTN